MTGKAEQFQKYGNALQTAPTIEDTWQMILEKTKA